MPTMGNAFGVLGRSGSGGTGAAGLFFRIFRPDGFCMVGILVTVESGGMRVRLFLRPGPLDTGQVDFHPARMGFNEEGATGFMISYHIFLFAKRVPTPSAAFL